MKVLTDLERPVMTVVVSKGEKVAPSSMSRKAAIKTGNDLARKRPSGRRKAT